jgi:hypothetical protein
MAENNTILDLDAMFDTKMDEVETLPDYVTPPAGNYELEVADVSGQEIQDQAEGW